jgi:hypothetical protein
MRNRTLPTAGRHEFIPSRQPQAWQIHHPVQLCNSPLHNWFVYPQPTRKSLHIHRMQQAGELL